MGIALKFHELLSLHSLRGRLRGKEMLMVAVSLKKHSPMRVLLNSVLNKQFCVCAPLSVIGLSN